MTASTDGVIRLGGLTSGFDTESIVSSILASDQATIDRLKEEKEINLAKIETWDDVAEQLKSFAGTVIKLRSDGTGSNTLFDNKNVTSTTETVATATASSSALATNYSLTVTNVARAHVAYGSQKGASYTLPSGGNIVLGNTTIALSSGDTLTQIATKINAASYPSGEEMVATVVDNRLTIQTQDTGASKTIHGTTAGSPPFVNATDDPANILQGELGIIDGGGNLVNEAQTSADASFSLNGIPITGESNTVTDAVEGVTINLLSSGSSNLNITHDTEDIKETLKDFIDGYNETRDLIDRVRNATISDDEDFGIFFSDPLMRSLFNEVRQLTTTGVQMGGTIWDGSITTSAASGGDTSVTINNFTAGTGTISAGDQFVISGDPTVYTVATDASISGNSATISIKPPLSQAASNGTSVSIAFRSIDEFGIGVRTDEVSGVAGVIGILDEGKLDAMLSSDVELIRRVFTRSDTTDQTTGIARRLYDWIDEQTKISVFTSKTRNIDDITIDSLDDSNERLDDRIAMLEDRLAVKEAALIRQFAEMENAMTRAQSASGSISALGGGGGQTQG